MSKNLSCQGCNRASHENCNSCVSTKGHGQLESPSGRTMTTIRDEVSELIAAAKLAGYRQAQREEFHHLCGLIGGTEPHDQIIERIRHLRKELVL